MCLVEVAGSNRLQAACTTSVQVGMEIRTNTPKLQDYRRMILELLFAERNHVCSVCVANNHCELQDLAMAHGMDHVRFDYLHPKCDVDTSHDRFGIDHNRCILCTRCVRACDEIEGAHTWDVCGRGTTARVVTDMHQPWGEALSCTSCGKCAQAALSFARDPQLPRWNMIAEFSNSLLRHGSKSNGSSEISHGLVGRMLRLPHVVF